MSIRDMTPYIQISPPSKILDILDSFETMPSLSTPINLIETPKKTNDASINSHEFLVIKFLRKQNLID